MAYEDAYGLKFVRKGFAKTPEDDVLFALGYPHIVTKPGEPARKLREAVVEALTTFEGQLHQLEATHGAADVATHAVDYITKLPAKAWKSGDWETFGDDACRALYFVLLRTPAKLAVDLRKRLEATFKKIAPTMKDGFWRPLEGLDVCLHGKKGVARSGYKPDDENLSLSDLIFCDDDPAFVVSELKRELPTIKGSDAPRFSARYGFVGGAAAVKLLRDNLGRFARSERKKAQADLDRVADKPK